MCVCACQISHFFSRTTLILGSHYEYSQHSRALPFVTKIILHRKRYGTLKVFFTTRLLQHCHTGAHSAPARCELANNNLGTEAGTQRVLGASSTHTHARTHTNSSSSWQPTSSGEAVKWPPHGFAWVARRVSCRACLTVAPRERERTQESAATPCCERAPVLPCCHAHARNCCACCRCCCSCCNM